MFGSFIMYMYWITLHNVTGRVDLFALWENGYCAIHCKHWAQAHSLFCDWHGFSINTQLHSSYPYGYKHAYCAIPSGLKQSLLYWSWHCGMGHPLPEFIFLIFLREFFSWIPSVHGQRNLATESSNKCMVCCLKYFGILNSSWNWPCKFLEVKLS